MAVTILIPAALRAFTGQKSEVSVSGSTVGEAIRAFTDKYPDIRKHLYQDENGREAPELRSFINVFVGETNIKNLDGVNTKISDGDTIMLIPAIAGGCCRACTFWVATWRRV